MHVYHLYLDIMLSVGIHLYSDIMISYTMNPSKVDEHTMNEAKTNSTRHIVLIMDDMVKYNRVAELGDEVNYHSKLISYYGFDVKTGKWDTKRFPVTKNDAQLKGIQSDIERYNNAVRDYNKYAEHLAKEFCIDIYDEVKKGHVVVFRPPHILTDVRGN
jgi:hypothetical protein